MFWLALAFLLLCSAIVSATETALFGLGPVALHDFRRSRGRLQRQVYRLMAAPGGPHRVLATVLITNTAVNVTLFSVAFFALRQIRDTFALAAALSSVGVPLAVIIFGEMLPKGIALANPRRLAPPAGGLIAALQLVLGPIQWILAKALVDPITRLLAPASPRPDTVTLEELKLLVEHSAREGVIDSTENEMLQAIVAVGDVRVREVMTPRVDIASVRIDDPRATAVEVARTSGHRRLPVCGHNLDDIRGVLYVRDLFLHPQASPKALVRRIQFVPEQVNLMQLLRYFRQEKIPMAVVVDEFGGTAGLVTMKDIAEWVIGDLPDAETPRPVAPTERIDENTYRLAGDLSVRVWADHFAVGEVDRQVDTVAGLILAKLGRMPRIGDAVRLRNLTLTVESMRRRRIERVLLHHDTEGSGVSTASEPRGG